MNQNQQGLTLLEVMISVLIFSMISVLIFSMLDRSVMFAAKGEARILKIEQQYGLVNLVRRQVQGAWFDQKLKKVHLASESEYQFSLITTSSLMFAQSTLVIVFYEFDPTKGILYYTERRDFYNSNYNDEFPEQADMIPLLSLAGDFFLHVDPDSDLVTLKYNGHEYVFHPFCSEQSQEF